MSTPNTSIGDAGKRGPSPSLAEILRLLHEKTMHPAFVRGVALAVVMAGILVTEAILHFRAADAASQRATTALTLASELRARAERELNSVLYLSSGIVAYLTVRHAQMDSDEVRRLLAAVYSRGRHIRNLALAEEYRIAYVHPLAGNEQAIGVDYRNLPAQWPSVQRAVASRNVILTGPVKLVQGGTGLIYRTPVLIGDRYWGILSSVIDIPSLCEAVFKDMLGHEMDVAIRIEDDGGTGGGMLWGKPELLDDPQAVRIEAPMPNGRWLYAVRLPGGNGSQATWAMRWLGWILAILAGLGVSTVLRQRRELSLLAGFDSLTGLPNRRLFDDRLEQSIRRHARNGIGQVAAIFLDLNDFKQINDQYGHKSGDAVLQIVAARIREEVRLGDTVSRWAGDEFALIIEDATENHVAYLVNRLHQRIALPIDLKGATLTVEAAIGAAFYPDETASSAELLELADQRMYENKAG